MIQKGPFASLSTDPHESAADAEPARRMLGEQALTPAREGRLVRLESHGAVLPPRCACCDTVAAKSTAESGPGSARIVVPYCDECQRHASSSATRRLSVSLASSLLAGSFAAALPLAWERIPLAVHALVTLAFALVPIAIAAFASERPAPGHAARARAVWWTSQGELYCANAGWAGELATLNRGTLRPARLKEPLLSPWLAAGPLTALIAIPVFHDFYNPMVRVLNLTETRLIFSVDGETEATIEPTSAESPAAGVELGVPAGTRHFQAFDPSGRLVAGAVVSVESAAHHLYAPGSTDYCFWLERTAYGKASDGKSSLVPLAGSARFWVLPSVIDTWFSPNPAAQTGDARSTGGVLTALRQAPCSAAPRAIREASEAAPP